MKYFDYASSTPVDPQVLDTYEKVLKEYYVNSDSLYPEGLKVNSLMNKSRHQVADLLRVKDNEILFTSGGSEANNMAIKGIALKHMEKGKHIITSSIEHSSVLNSCKWLEKNLGFEVTYLSVNREGKVDPEYNKCIDIATQGAIKELIPAGLVAILSTILVGFIGGVYAIGGFLVGNILSGLLLSLFMSNAGGLWDNAKKFVESGNEGGKGSEAHKAAVVGDTVGDPFKDTAGPSINTQITVVSLIASLLSTLFLTMSILH